MFSAKIRKKSIGKMRSMRLLAVLIVPVVALIMGAAVPEGWAQDDDPVCWFNIEFNASDLDVGVRGFFDYEPWEELEIEDPNGNTIAEVKAKGSMKDQGFAEWMYESGEPNLENLSLEEFFDRFPVGTYEFKAEPIEERSVLCEAGFTHVIPCAPEISAAGNRGNGLTISWEPVTTVVNPDATDDEEVVCEEGSVNIVGYEVIVEEEESEKIFKIDLPASDETMSVTVPPEFIALGEKFQYEVLAIEESGNQTITEEEFCLNERNGQVEECPEDE